jgi:hypothetical protein
VPEETMPREGFLYKRIIGDLAVVRFPKEMLKYTFKKWPNGIYEFIGIGWRHYYVGLFKAGIKE